MDWIESFNCDFPPSPQKPKPLSEMTDNEMLNFITRLIQHEIRCDRLKTYHPQNCFRRNKIDSEGEDVSEQVQKLEEERSLEVHSTSTTSKETKA